MPTTIIPLHYYIAFNKPQAALGVMEDFGYTVTVRDKTDLAKTIAHFLSREGEKGLQAMAKIHPDRELILSYNEPSSTLGADGFQDLPATAKAPAPTIIQPEPKQQTDYSPLIIASILASALFVSVAVISISKK